MVRWMRWQCPPDTCKIRNSSPDGLRPSTLPLGHGGSPKYWIFMIEWAEKKNFVSLKLEGHSGVRTRDLRFSKQAALTTALGPSAWLLEKEVTTQTNTTRWPNVDFVMFVCYSCGNHDCIVPLATKVISNSGKWEPLMTRERKIHTQHTH